MSNRQELANVAEQFDGNDRTSLLSVAFNGSEDEVMAALYEADEKLSNRRGYVNK